MLKHRKAIKELTTMQNLPACNVRKNSELVCLLQEHWDQKGEIKDIRKCLGSENDKTNSATEFCSTKDGLD